MISVSKCVRAPRVFVEFIEVRVLYVLHARFGYNKRVNEFRRALFRRRKLRAVLNSTVTGERFRNYFSLR